jgi:PAS domain S-box-containing protein
MAEALEEVSRKNRAMVENARDVMFSVDEHGTFLSISPASQSVFGYSPEDLVGSKLIRIVAKSDGTDVLAILKKVIEGGDEQPFEFRIERKDGRIIDIRCSVHWVKTEKTIFCQAYDITEAKQAERLRQEIMQMVSHDLKTPLSTVRSFLEMLDAGMFGEINDRGRKLMKMADNSTSRMLTLIRDLLEIEKMEAGMLQLQVSDQQLQDLFEQAAGSVASQAAEHSIRLVCDPCQMAVHVDPDRVIQVLTNLLTNAIKFSPESETITVSAQEVDGNVEVRVRDRGRGIPEHMIDGIFGRFSQVKASDATEKGGSGLGLAICKALVELHGGKIRVESVENEGSTFAFTLPKSVGFANDKPISLTKASVDKAEAPAAEPSPTA